MSTRHRLLRILQAGGFHSGEALGGALGVSRAAVWKALRSLPELGIVVDAVPGRGYRLREPLELLDPRRVRGALSARGAKLLAELEVLEEVDSTNSHLLARAVCGAPAGSACLAEYQRAGRGRRGRAWVSPFGSNLYLSVLWRYTAGASVAQGLSLAVGVALAELLAQAGARGVRLKWPNDVLCDGRKLAGVLTELSGEAGGDCHVVVGVGLNLRMPAGAAPAIDQPWADLASACDGQPPSRNELAGALLDRVLTVLSRFADEGLAPHLESWSALDALREQPLVLHTPRGDYEGIGAGVDASGALRVRGADGERLFHAAEVSLRGAA